MEQKQHKFLIIFQILKKVFQKKQFDLHHLNLILNNPKQIKVQKTLITEIKNSKSKIDTDNKNYLKQ